MEGYSATPLYKKLGVKSGFDVALIDPPAGLSSALAIDGIGSIMVLTKADPLPSDCNIIQYFTKSVDELEKTLPLLKSAIKQNGMVWISWPKKASKVPSDVTEDVIRALAIAIGMVDVKVCAVDDIWSGLKLVIPVRDRTSA